MARFLAIYQKGFPLSVFLVEIRAQLKVFMLLLPSVALYAVFFRASSEFSPLPPANLRARFMGFYSIYKIKRTEFYPSVLFGGDKGIRTPDLLTASQAL